MSYVSFVVILGCILDIVSQVSKTNVDDNNLLRKIMILKFIFEVGVKHRAVFTDTVPGSHKSGRVL